MIIMEMEQHSDEWFAEKLGKPSASNASVIMSKGETRKTYMRELADQIVSGYREEHFKSKFMEVGNEREPESRDYFELVTGHSVKQVGLIYPNEDKKYLCSPDGLLVNEKIGLELKNVKGSTQVAYLLKNEVPSNYMAQIQMSLLITGFEYWYFFSYKPGLRPMIKKVERDEVFISKLEFELNLFVKELQVIVNKIK